MKRLACFSLFAACLAAILSQATHAGKTSGGGGTSNSLGPVTITPDLVSFEDRYSDLGGVLDHHSGLIWGYDSYSMGGFGSTLDGSAGLLAVGENAEYLDELEFLVNVWLDPTRGNDPATAAIYESALSVAEQFTWRLPTVAEARDAVSRGLFTYGTGGCNVYFGSPTYSVPDVVPATGWRWSSNLGGKVKGGLDSAWYWDLEDGSAAVIGNGVIFAIWVRTATAAELGQ